MDYQEITTRCHSCARRFDIEICVDEEWDGSTYEMPAGERATCGHCSNEHTAGFEMVVITDAAEGR